MLSVVDTRRSCIRLVEYVRVGGDNSQGMKGANGSRDKAKLLEACSVSWGGVGDENSNSMSGAHGSRHKAKLWEAY